MSEIFDGEPVYVSGKFPGLGKDEVWAWLLGAGAVGTASKSAARAYLCPDRGDEKLAASGRPIYTLDALGPPLAGYADRLAAAVESRQAELRRREGLVAHFGRGAPADDALIARVEAALGFPAPAELVALMRQFNGLSAVVATLKRGHRVELGAAPLPYAALADSSHPLWQGAIEWLIGVVAIPRWEEVFLRPQRERLCDRSAAFDAKAVVKIGGLKVRAGELFPRLFAFDLFHPFAGAALYADPKTQGLQVIYAVDHWADLTSAQPLALRTYMESLVAGIWGRMAHVGQRPVRPVSKTAWPSYVRDVHGAPYVFLELT